MRPPTAVIGGLVKLPDSPTSLLASDSTIPRHILLAFQERGVQVPSDVSLIALDDFPWSPLTLPPLTVMSQPIYEAGFAAGQAALDAIEGRTSQIAKLEANMVYRSSHGPVAS